MGKNENDVAISSDGNYLVASGGSGPGSLYFFNINTNNGKDLYTFSDTASKSTKINTDFYYSFNKLGTLYAKVELLAGEIYLIDIDGDNKDMVYLIIQVIRVKLNMFQVTKSLLLLP